MSEETNHKSRKQRRRTRRLIRRIISWITFLIMVYIVVLLMAIFDGSKIGQFFRQYEFINQPAEYLVEQFDIDTSFFTIDITDQAKSVVIRVNEDNIYFDNKLITIDELEGLLSGKVYNISVIDDNAKHVTYTAVIDELERIGVDFNE